MKWMKQVLIKSFVLMHVPLYKRTQQSIENTSAYETLTSVCSTWRTVPQQNRRWFTRTWLVYHAERVCHDQRVQYDKFVKLGESLYRYVVDILVVC